MTDLTTGHEDAEKATLAFLVATAALEHRRPVLMFATKEAMRLGLPGYADAIAIPDESALIAPARIGGATALWDWVGNGDATVFSY